MMIVPDVGLLFTPSYESGAQLVLKWLDCDKIFVNEVIHGWDINYCLTIVDRSGGVHILNRAGGSKGEHVFAVYAEIKKHWGRSRCSNKRVV